MGWSATTTSRLRIPFRSETSGHGAGAPANRQLLEDLRRATLEKEVVGERMGELLAFTTEHVSRLTGLSNRQLRYWSDTDFFTPKVAETGRGRPFGRVYSFRDVVGLRTISILRNEHRVPLQELRKVGEWLSKLHDTPWASLRFYVSGKAVYFDDPRSGTTVAARPLGQTVLSIDLKVIAHDMSAAAARLRERTPDQYGKFERHRYVVHNAFVVAGTRVPTSAIWNLHEAGYSEAAIILEYPRLKLDDVQGALEFEQSRRKRKRTG